MKKINKITRLVLLDFKKGIVSKIVLVIEIIACIVLLSIAMGFMVNAKQSKNLYKNLGGVYVQYFSENAINNNEYRELFDKIYSENEIGEISYITSATEKTGLYIYSYNDVMLEKIPIKLCKGKLFSENYLTDEYAELILSNNYANKYKIGQVISHHDLGVGVGNFNGKYKVIGFFQTNYKILDHQYYTSGTNIGLIREGEVRSSNYLDSKMIFTNCSKEQFAKKYNIVQSDKLQFNIVNTKDMLESNMQSENQIATFFQMFFIIAIGVYFTTIVSGLVVKYNDNLQFNKNMINIGVTRNNFLLVKLVRVLIISLLSIVASSIIVSVVSSILISELLKSLTLTVGIVIASSAIILLSYLVFEVIEVVFMYYNFVKRR